jgi:hypothetical protein
LQIAANRKFIASTRKKRKEKRKNICTAKINLKNELKHIPNEISAVRGKVTRGLLS